MKTQCFSLLLLCLLLLPAHAQVGTPKYNFQNRAQVEAATRKYKLNLRESYNIILCAKRQGMIKSVVHVYEQEVGNPFDTPPQLSSSFALAYHFSTVTGHWNWRTDSSRGLTELNQSDGIRITNYREQALQKLPNSPEVLLGYAIWAKDQGNEEKAVNLTSKALRISPEWADLNWWHSQMLDARIMNMSPEREKRQEKPRYGGLMLRFISKAERLDPYLKSEGLIAKSSAFTYANRPAEALESFDTYVRYNPGVRKYLGETGYQKWRNSLVAATKENANS